MKSWVLLLSVLIIVVIRSYFFSPSNKYLIIGSAPYVKEWVRDNLSWFVENNYKIVVFNNSWKLVDLPLIHKWHHSDNHLSAGTFVPTTDEKRSMNAIQQHMDTDTSNHLYKNPTKTTMFCNIMYYYIHKHPCEIVIVGCDMMYSKSGDTFYSHLKTSKASNDPILRLGEKGLNDELDHCYDMCKKYAVIVHNASVEKTRLPFPRFTDHLR